jgi:hypothetical protein
LEKANEEYQYLIQEASYRYGALEDQYEKDKEGWKAFFEVAHGSS